MTFLYDVQTFFSNTISFKENLTKEVDEHLQEDMIVNFYETFRI